MSIQDLLRYKCVFKIMLAIALLLGAVPQVSIAMPVSSQAAFHSELASNVYMQKIQSFLDRQIVQKKLAKMGISPKDIYAYLNNMPHSQLKQLAAKVDTVKSGGDGGLVIVLMLLLIVMAVLYFTDYGLKLEPRDKK